MRLPEDYSERVYAGVLGKMIGVYLGRPFEGWTYERILSELGEIKGYVHERLAKPLLVTDDDLSGTFTFLRALPDHGNRHALSRGRDRGKLAELPHRDAYHLVVGWAGKFYRTYCLPAPEIWSSGAQERLRCAERECGC